MFWCRLRGLPRCLAEKTTHQAAGPEYTGGGCGTSGGGDACAGWRRRLQAKLALTSVAATVMEPASEYGRAAMDELHQQTVNLLSFQTLPREQYDAQVSFNLLPELGEAAKVKLGATEQRIRRHYSVLSEGRLPALALQIVQAPVFHGYVRLDAGGGWQSRDCGRG